MKPKCEECGLKKLCEFYVVFILQKNTRK
ncbi:MAG: hypothetical protein LBG59_09965 [Candidatus Peribacteria bacterium]|nr:hypothetical protein [Candidatus Peribacteria bacterium]